MPIVEVVPIPLAVQGPRGVNAFLVLGERPILVDALVPGHAPEILDVLEAHHVAAESVAAIVITHGHVDHAGSLHALKLKTGAPVIAHRHDVEALRTGTSEPVQGRTPGAQAMIESGAVGDAPPFAAVDVDVVVEDEFDLAPYGVAATLIHTPGHTPGGLSMVTADNEVIVGDLIGSAAGDPSRADLAPFATDTEALDASVRRVIALHPARVYCGHGGPFSAEALASFEAELS